MYPSRRFLFPDIPTSTRKQHQDTLQGLIERDIDGLLLDKYRNELHTEDVEVTFPDNTEDL